MSETLAVWCCSKCGAIYHQDFPRCPADGAEVILSLEDPLIGQQLGHYVIEKLIAEGGMGRVYFAKHAHLQNKQYAIKVLLGDFASTPSMRMRFTNEAENASRLSHPNLVPVLDFGCSPQGLPYIVMEFVSGRSLAKLMDEGPMDPARVIRIARGVCTGLVYAHGAGVVHRDLKPDNIMIVTTATGDEVPRIADFGLAVTTDPNDARLTSTGMAVGTPAYCAPEQSAGKRVDHRADLYALGTTMFEMLSCEIPFEGTPLEIMTAKAHVEARKVGEVGKATAVPKELEALIAKLIKRNSNARPEDAAAVIAALDAIDLTHDVEAVATATAAEAELLVKTEPLRSTPRDRRRGRWIGAAVLVAGAATGVWWWQRPAAAKHATVVEVPRAAATTVAIAGSGSITGSAIESGSGSTSGSALASASASGSASASDSGSGSGSGSGSATAVASTHPIRQPAHQRSHHHTAREARVATEAVVPVVPVATVTVPVPTTPLPPKPPAPLDAQLGSVDVSGSLSGAVVRRAVERVFPSVQQCAPTGTPFAARVTFTITESRRAQNVHVSGAAGAATCLSSVFGGLRSEAAPDVGDAEVTVQVAFQVKP